MTALHRDAVSVGDQLPTLQVGPLSRATLALFAGASGDHNPVHIDSDIAKAVGMADVFAQGMLSMGLLGHMLTNWVPQSQIREYGVRFATITPVLATVTCAGRVIEKFEADGETRVRVELTAEIDGGVRTLQGDAVVALA